VNGNRLTRELGYLIQEGSDSLEALDFYCLWTGKGALEWERIRPQQVRVRLRLDLVRDG